jgi:putative RecB family exonuclease
MPDHLSASQINLYLLCSLKYRFQYVDELRRPFRPSALALGASVHAALAWFHQQMLKGNGATLEKVWKIFEADWYAQGLDTEILCDGSQTEAGLNILGKELLRVYLARPETKVRGAEVPFTVPLKNPANGDQLEVNLEGFIDLITADEAIVEFKTSSQAMTSLDAANQLQLTAYSYAYEMLFRRPAAALRIVDLVKAKKPRMVVLETVRTKADHERFFWLAKEVLSGIRSRVFFPRTGFWCRDCEYAQQCRAWKGN